MFVVVGLVALSQPAFAVDWYTGSSQYAETPKYGGSQVRPATPYPGNNYIVAFDGAATVTSNASAFGALTTTFAPLGRLNQSGVRVRFQEVAGVYSYPIGGVAGVEEHGTQEEGTVLTGYEWIWQQAAVAGFIGFNVRRNSLQIPDPTNSVVGTGVGAKGAFDVYYSPTPLSYFQANLSYSTLFQAYYARMRGGIMVAKDVFVGPELTLLGDNFFNQYRVGGHIVGVGFDNMKFSLGAGWAYDRRQGTGYYTDVEGRAAF